MALFKNIRILSKLLITHTFKTYFKPARWYLGLNLSLPSGAPFVYKKTNSFTFALYYFLALLIPLIKVGYDRGILQLVLTTLTAYVCFIIANFMNKPSRKMAPPWHWGWPLALNFIMPYQNYSLIAMACFLGPLVTIAFTRASKSTFCLHPLIIIALLGLLEQNSHPATTPPTTLIALVIGAVVLAWFRMLSWSALIPLLALLTWLEPAILLEESVFFLTLFVLVDKVILPALIPARVLYGLILGGLIITTKQVLWSGLLANIIAPFLDPLFALRRGFNFANRGSNRNNLSKNLILEDRSIEGGKATLHLPPRG